MVSEPVPTVSVAAANWPEALTRLCVDASELTDTA